MKIDWPIISDIPMVQAYYQACRESGTSHSLAEMFALAMPPMGNTDREFLEGHCNGNQFEKTPHIGNYYKAVADKRGVDITGKVYLSGLAAYPGDPRAWISGRGDAQKIIEERGWEATGSINVKAKQRQEHKEIGLAEDIVNDEVAKIVADSPEPIKDITAIREKIIKKRKPHWSKIA